MPVFGGILHFGMIWPAAVLLSAAAVLLRPDFFRRLLRPRWLRRAVSLLAAVCAAAVLVTLGMMARAAGNRPPEDMPCTVIVLGCQVLEDGRPSLMLQKRIDAAYGYLSAHPDAACVASGGLDDSETVTEAQCIRSTLVSMGIDEGRIYLEDRSAPPRRICPSPPPSYGSRACRSRRSSPPTTSTSCAPPSGQSGTG